MVPFLYISLACAHALALPSSVAHLNFPFLYRAPTKLAQTIFGRESHLATRRGQQNNWNLFVLSIPSRSSWLITAPSSWDYGFDKWKPHLNFIIKENQGGTPQGGGGTPYNGLYGEAMPERATFFKPQVYARVEILYSFKFMKGWENLSFRSVKGPKRANRWILWLYKVEKTFFFCDWFLFKRPCIYSS